MAEQTYKTKQRDYIIDCLRRNSDKSLTADDIFESLRSTGSSVGKATIYRFLDTLTGEGCVRKFIATRGTGATYQYIEHNDCDHHFHLKCTRCGSLEHLDCDFMTDIDRHILEHHNFVVDNSKTVLYGICKNCSSRKA